MLATIEDSFNEMRADSKKLNEEITKERVKFHDEVSAILAKVEPCMRESKADNDYFRGKMMSFAEEIKNLKNIRTDVNTNIKEFDKKIFTINSDIENKITEVSQKISALDEILKE